MSSPTYNLSDNVEDTFPFEISGKKYVMRYPITDEVDKIQELSYEVQKAAKDEDIDKAEKLGNDLSELFYSFISPVEHEESIRDVLQKENVRVMRNFNRMIRTELAIQ